jgi:divalent metal cation (Fe/Co/Zn/Cd) transporter
MMLKGSARHWLADAVMSFGIFAGFLLGFVSEQYGYGFLAPYVDPAMAIALALFFMCTPIKSIISNMRELLDAAPKPEHSTARQIIEQAGLGQLKLDKLRARKGGDKVFLQAYFSVHPGMTVSESHECAGKIEEQLRRHFENCEVSVLFKPAH